MWKKSTASISKLYSKWHYFLPGLNSPTKAHRQESTIDTEEIQATKASAEALSFAFASLA